MIRTTLSARSAMPGLETTLKRKGLQTVELPPDRE